MIQVILSVIVLTIVAIICDITWYKKINKKTFKLYCTYTTFILFNFFLICICYVYKHI
jgi:hypothetical protein